MQFKQSRSLIQLPLLFSIAVFNASCSSGSGGSDTDDITPTPDSNNPPPLASDLSEPFEHYVKDGYDKLDVLAVNIKTVTTAGTCDETDISGCTFADVNQDVDGSDDFKPKISAHMLATDYVEDNIEINAQFKLRGDTSRSAPQKSYSIKLNKELPLWRNERRMQLNKHPYDETRVRNKLSFDLMKEVKHLNSLRTQFVQLSVEDNGQQKDYGLFTHVERVGKNYTANRGYEAGSPIYKAINFRFTRLPDRLRIDENGAPVEKDQFERNLEIEEGEDHSKLIEMLDALNDPDSDKKAVLEKYFNENNIVTWLAVNILVGNADTVDENYFLFNPNGTDRFYYLPWDYDTAFKEPISLNIFTGQELIRRQADLGVGKWWSSVLIRTWLSQEGSYKKLTERVTQLRETVFTDEKISSLVDSYIALIQTIVTSAPDLENIYGTSDQNKLDEWLFSTGNMATNLSVNYDQFINDPGWPMPVVLGDSQLNGDTATFNWSPSVDFQGDTISYKLELSDNPEFSDTILSQTGIEHTVVKNVGEAEKITLDAIVGVLPPDTYYWRVITSDSADPVNNLRPATGWISIDDVRFYGIQKLIVE